jgi:curli production assembly/transport component CsgE
MSVLLKAAAAMVFVAWAPWASAASGEAGTLQKDKRDRKVRDESFGGFVVNQTVTPAGQNFYLCFVAAWRDRQISERYAISIHERASARKGSQVWIEFAQKPVFQAVLPSSLSNIKALSEQAVEVAQQKVLDVEVDRQFFRESDFGPDEM